MQGTTSIKKIDKRKSFCESFYILWRLLTLISLNTRRKSTRDGMAWQRLFCFGIVIIITGLFSWKASCKRHGYSGVSSTCRSHCRLSSLYTQSVISIERKFESDSYGRVVKTTAEILVKHSLLECSLHPAKYWSEMISLSSTRVQCNASKCCEDT